MDFDLPLNADTTAAENSVWTVIPKMKGSQGVIHGKRLANYR